MSLPKIDSITRKRLTNGRTSYTGLIEGRPVKLKESRYAQYTVCIVWQQRQNLMYHTNDIRSFLTFHELKPERMPAPKYYRYMVDITVTSAESRPSSATSLCP